MDAGSRERAARALCRRNGYDEDQKFDGKPAWEWYLDRVDLVLDAVLPPEAIVHFMDKKE